jgi:hypothetical protein
MHDINKGLNDVDQRPLGRPPEGDGLGIMVGLLDVRELIGQCMVL